MADGLKARCPTTSGLNAPGPMRRTREYRVTCDAPRGKLGALEIEKFHTLYFDLISNSLGKMSCEITARKWHGKFNIKIDCGAISRRETSGRETPLRAPGGRTASRPNSDAHDVKERRRVCAAGQAQLLETSRWKRVTGNRVAGNRVIGIRATGARWTARR